MEKGETRNNTVGKGFQLCGMEHSSITALTSLAGNCIKFISLTYIKSMQLFQLLTQPLGKAAISLNFTEKSKNL